MTAAAYTELFTADVTIPAGTPVAAPAVTAIPIPGRVVDRVEIMFPAGLNGLVGIALGMAGQPVLPANAGAWIIANAETIGRDVAGLPESGAWQVFGYNTGAYDHTVHVRFWTHVTRRTQAAPQAVIPDLSAWTSATPDNIAALAALEDATANPGA